jgi:ABC-type transport system substrate-binding protein
MPNPSHHIPRSLLIFLLVVIAATLLAGTFRAFAPARAQAAASPTPTLTATDTPTVTEFDPKDTPPTQSPSLPAGPESADTTGIIAQAIVLVVIIVFGAAWGWRMSTPHLPRKNKNQ